ncbi:MAG TPA: LysE family translocator [Solirubrobacter sp.]|nr:LysE family translocator [Solirubrobacter sp.]
MSSLLAFAALSVVLVLIPGPAVMLVLKHALARGRGPALFTAIGVLVADLTWALASVAGLTALLVSSQIAFDVVRYLGAAYLIYLGIRLILTRQTPITSEDPEPGRPTRHGALRAFREGLIGDLSNPKTIIIFTSIIPQFLNSNASPLDALILGITFAMIGFLNLTAYALAFGTAAGLLRDARITRSILRIGGALLTAFGIGLAAERPAST